MVRFQSCTVVKFKLKWFKIVFVSFTCWLFEDFGQFDEILNSFQLKIIEDWNSFWKWNKNTFGQPSWVLRPNPQDRIKIKGLKNWLQDWKAKNLRLVSCSPCWKKNIIWWRRRLSSMSHKFKCLCQVFREVQFIQSCHKESYRLRLHNSKWGSQNQILLKIRINRLQELGLVFYANRWTERHKSTIVEALILLRLNTINTN